jgi:protein phosphatase
MRVLLIADVHANWPALLALQRAEPKPDAVLFAGDAVGYGPDPGPCARWLWANARVAVQGEHDAALGRPGGVAGAPPELADAAQATLTWTRQQLTAADCAQLGQWPDGHSGLGWHSLRLSWHAGDLWAAGCMRPPRRKRTYAPCLRV